MADYKDNKAFGGRETPYEQMIKDADTLFSLGWLRKRFVTLYQQAVASMVASESTDFKSKVTGSIELDFAYRYMFFYRTELHKVTDIVYDLFKGENARKTLTDERKLLIAQLVAIPFARGWVTVRKEEPESWKCFARRAASGKRNEKEFDEFFQIIDHISIITDFLNYKAKTYYNVDFDPSDYDVPKTKLTLEILIKSINACQAEMNTASKWAVVFRVLKEDYPKGFFVEGQDVIKNASTFESFMGKYNERNPEVVLDEEIPICTSSTISHACNKNKLFKPISEWPEGDMKTLAKKLRDAIKKEGIVADVVPEVS